ncbi:MAG: hypothetical protein HYR63_07520 [Proteobacteria bacterium]|nr:hypothetical protein [Pseudomonadota bacterium]
MSAIRPSRHVFSALVLSLALAGCAARGSVENPVSRIATWFDYLGAGDIHTACKDGAPDRYRFVYNGIYHEQVRTYEINPNPVFSGGTVEARAFNPLNLTMLDYNSLNIFLRGVVSRQPIDGPGLAELDRALAADADATRAPKDTFLRSDRFYWTVGACRSGRFYYAGFADTLPGFEGLRFPAILVRYDTTGVKVNPSRKLDNDFFNSSDYSDRKQAIQGGPVKFFQQLDENGLKQSPLF